MMSDLQPWVSRNSSLAVANYAPEVRAQLPRPARVEVHDVTLRDGEGTPGVIFTREEKLAIARRLAAARVPRIEAGEMGVSAQELQAIGAVAHLDVAPSTVWTWSGAAPDRIDQALSTGAAGIMVGVPVGDPTMKSRGLSRSATIRSAVDAVLRVKAGGARAVFFMVDATRAEMDWLDEIAHEVAIAAEPEAITIVDTRGVALPQTFAYLVQRVKAASRLPVEVHCHNDFGLAVANSLASVAAGAEVVHTGVAGLGERCGNTPLEAFVIAMELLYDYRLGIATEMLYELARFVSAAAGIRMSGNQPVVGGLRFRSSHGQRD